MSYHVRALREGSEEDEENAARTDDKDRKRYRHCKSHRELHEGCRYVGQHTEKIIDRRRKPGNLIHHSVHVPCLAACDIAFPWCIHETVIVLFAHISRKIRRQLHALDPHFPVSGSLDQHDNKEEPKYQNKPYEQRLFVQLRCSKAETERQSRVRARPSYIEDSENGDQGQYCHALQQ